MGIWFAVIIKITIFESVDLVTASLLACEADGGGRCVELKRRAKGGTRALCNAARDMTYV